MSFKNIFGTSKGEAEAAENSAHDIYGKSPGAQPEEKGVDPELLDAIPDTERDPKILRETSPEALSIMNTFLSPLFKNTPTSATDQRETSENPRTTSDMASSDTDDTYKTVNAVLATENRPNISDGEREK